MHEEGVKGGDSEDWRQKLLVNSGSPSEQVVQPQAIPEQNGSAEETVANGSSEEAKQQLEELTRVQTEEGSTSSSPTPRVQSSGPRRERGRPAYLAYYVT